MTEGSGELDLTVLALPLSPTVIERIDAETERHEEETGVEYSREKFVRSAINAQLDRAEKQRWAEEHAGEGDS